MDTLKKIFPFSFKEKPDVKSLVINIVMYVVAAAIIGVLLTILGKLPLVGLITYVTGTVVELYVTAGIVLTVLNYCGVLK